MPDDTSIPVDDSHESPPSPLPKTQAEFFARAAEKVRSKFPTAPGVYLFQDQAGRVLYIGKAKNLRARAGSYFLQAAADDQRTSQLVREAYDVDFLEAESEVDALLLEARLIKDIQPKYNRDLRDDKTFPYLQITTHEDFPRVEVTREPRSSGVKLYGPFASAGSLRGAMQVLQRVFKFRTCSLDIEADDERWRWFRPCLLASINQCTAPCNLRISQGGVSQGHPAAADVSRRQSQAAARRDAGRDAGGVERNCSSRRPPGCATKSRCSRASRERGELDKHEQPEVFYIDPKKGLAGLAEDPQARRSKPRNIEGVDIAHLGGNETVASLVQFLDGLPFKPGYRRLPDPRRRRASTTTPASAKSWPGASAGCATMATCSPTSCLIDGGNGQLRKGARGVRDS